jgi:hypothetical protein
MPLYLAVARYGSLKNRIICGAASSEAAPMLFGRKVEKCLFRMENDA